MGLDATMACQAADDVPWRPPPLKSNEKAAARVTNRFPGSGFSVSFCGYLVVRKLGHRSFTGTGRKPRKIRHVKEEGWRPIWMPALGFDS